MELERHGWGRRHAGLDDGLLDELRREAFCEGSAGQRCLLDLPSVRTAALAIKQRLIADDLLPSAAVAIQAIAFDKTAATNWKVAWHQDLMFPFAEEVRSPDYDLPSCKSGVAYARPPREVLEALLAVRLHLDDCGESNGPLRVSPGTHTLGILPSSEAATRAAACGEVSCLAREGELILMRPLLLHASSQAASPGHRRVLHFVYHSGQPLPERWHRCL